MKAERQFSAAEQALIRRIERAGASCEGNQYGWGFYNATDKALMLIKKIAGVEILDLFEACEAGDVSDEGLAAIKDMTSLRYLALGPGISDAGLAHVSLLTELRELRLDSAADVTDRGLACLRKLTKLQKLSLQYTDITSDGLPQLGHLERLKELNLEATGVTQEAIDSFHKLLPRCKVLWPPELARPAKRAANKKVASGHALKLRATLRGHANKPSHAAFSPDGTLLAVVSFGKVIIWEASSGVKRSSFGVKRGALWGAAFTPDGKLFASGSNLASVYLWDTDGKEQKCWHTDNPVFTAVDIDPAGKYLAAGGQDGRIYVWELPGGKLHHAIKTTDSDFLSAVAFAPDGATVAASARESFIRLWNVSSGRLKLQLDAPPHKTKYDMIADFAFSPDGVTVAAAHPDQTIRFWDASDGKEMAALECPQKVSCLAYHPHGRILAVGSDGDTLVRLWDLTQRTPLAEFETNADFDRVNFVAFSPDGTTLATNGKGGSTILLEEG